MSVDASFMSAELISVAENSVDYLVQKAGLRAITLAQKPEPGTVTFKLYDNLGHATKTEEVEDITRWQVVGHSVTSALTPLPGSKWLSQKSDWAEESKLRNISSE